jgi:hypothetical protein
MAAGILAKPGTDPGPCKGECHHRDCAETRRMAASTCRICGKPIGYERRFYRAPDGPPGALLHAICLEDEVDATRPRR